MCQYFHRVRVTIISETDTLSNLSEQIACCCCTDDGPQCDHVVVIAVHSGGDFPSFFASDRPPTPGQW